MTYKGDFAPLALVPFLLNTHQKDGTPITLVGGAAAVLRNVGASSTSGVTLTTDVVTGLHSVTVDTSADGTFYAAGNDFDVILTAGTVDGVSVAGRAIGSFSINNRVAGLDAVPIEAGLNARQALAIMSAALAGQASGANTTNITFKGAGVATTRIEAVVDAYGNRTAVTLTPPA